MAHPIDIYDANLRALGVMNGKEAHLAGQWHRTFHCWVYRTIPTPQVLFQLRAPEMDNYGNTLDISAAGHLKAGEEVSEGIREVHEELGIAATIQDMIYLGERVEVANHKNGQRNREYQSVYLLPCELTLEQYKPDPREVWGLYWVPLFDGLELFSGQADTLEIVGIEYSPESDKYAPATKVVGIGDFLPRIQRYYLAALISVERACEGKQHFAIS